MRPIWSSDHNKLLNSINTDRPWLVIQDLDGVCMQLVNDPMTRCVDPEYVRAASQLDGHFFVLTNGEHIGSRGMNGIVNKAVGSDLAKHQGLYLPGLAAGGVQYQDRFGKVSHPGISSAEMAFLLQIPVKARYFLINLLGNAPYSLAKENIQMLAESVVLDNRVSPTVNINLLSAILGSVSQVLQLQTALDDFVKGLLREAEAEGLTDSFFIHYAPNLGRDSESGLERIKPADNQSWGTTDFQFMVRGAIKEAGVMVLLNRYYKEKIGVYPLGESFSARDAPRDHESLLSLAKKSFDPELMPRLIGVGDTITSTAIELDGEVHQMRGGSDRGFLTLVQDMGKQFEVENQVVLIDSSGGEVIRPSTDPVVLNTRSPECAGFWEAVSGLSDADDPLKVNYLFSGGHQEYIRFFKSLPSLLR